MTRRIILVDIGSRLTLAGVLPSVALLADYSAQLKARGGQAPYTYTVTTGAAELTAAGLQLDPATGILSGTASVPGTIAITVRATDLSGAYVERGFTVPVIAEPLSLSGAAPMWTVGTPYSYAYTAAHGVPPYTWSIASGSLPAGLTLGATGEISGTPTAGNAPAWTVRVTDSAGTIIDLRDNATLQLLGDFADASIGSAYSSDLLVNGGDAPYSNPRVTVGALPAGLALSIVGDKLRLSGTPTAAATSSFTVAVDSADGQTTTSAQSVDVTTTNIRGLIAIYRLDETSGVVAHDSSGNGNHGTYVGGNVTHGQASLLPSGSGGGTRFGSQSYMSLPDGVLSTTGRPFTIFGWGKSSNAAAAQGQQIMCSATGGFNFYLYQSKMYGGISGISNNIIDSRSVASNTAHFWALTVDSSGTAVIYDNAVASSPVASAFSSSAGFSNAVVVGNYSNDATHNYFQGALQNVGVCNVALTQAELTDIYTTS